MEAGSFGGLLLSNRNYRFTWIGQVVSEVGDHFNNIAVFSLALANTGSGLTVAGILLSRGAAVMLAGPVAGVLLDRMDRRRIMILSDIIRAVLALAFPRFRGGPLRYVDTVGAAEALRRVQGYADRFGERLRPAPLLVHMAKKGERFYA